MGGPAHARPGETVLESQALGLACGPYIPVEKQAIKLNRVI